jgi:aspartate/methionine/tyrosine aminotransferase
MTLKLSRRSAIPPFRALDLLRVVNERAAAGEDIIRLEAGQPSSGAPPEALEYARSVISRDPRQGYTEALGMKLLRDRIAVWYRDEYGIDLDHSRIAVTIGASGAFLLAFLAVFEAGDRVAMGVPCYPPYRNILRTLGVEVVEIETTAKTNYQPTLAQLEALKGKIDGLVIASPGNPAGTLIAPEELKSIVAWCERKGVRLVSDELFQKITFGATAETVLRHTQNAVVANSFSKYFAMTGWRLGWVVLPPDVMERVKALSESLFVSPPTLAQHVAYKVFDHIDVLDGHVKTYGENLAILKRELPKAGFTKLSDTKGTFYLYADVSDLTDDSIEFCRRMLDEAKVACTPGIDFDEKRGHGTIRISFGGTTAHIIEGCERLKKWRQKLDAALPKQKKLKA